MDFGNERYDGLKCFEIFQQCFFLFSRKLCPKFMTATTVSGISITAIRSFQRVVEFILLGGQSYFDNIISGANLERADPFSCRLQQLCQCGNRSVMKIGSSGPDTFEDA